MHYARARGVAEMAAINPMGLQDCGHVGQFASVCQYEGCGTKLCTACSGACEACGSVLCPYHQVWLSGRQRVFCPADSPGFVFRKLALHVLTRRRRR